MQGDNILVTKNQPHGRPRSRRQAFIRMGLKARGEGDFDWGYLAQNRKGQATLSNEVVHLHFQ